jgi:hypothetical protein
VDLDVHRATSAQALRAMTDALNAEGKASGAKDTIPSLDYQDTAEPQLADFKKFADAVQAWAARNPQLTADRIADVAIAAMIRVSPDCHTAYVNKSGRVFNSRPQNTSGSGPRAPSGGTQVFGPDSAGLQAKVLANGIAYVTFREWPQTGTYKIVEELPKALAKAVDAGAKAWLFDLRGNPGGVGPETAASWFLNGEPIFTLHLKNGNAGTMTAQPGLRLPAAYQLPIAIVVNGTSASATEVFALALKENKRATIVGGTTVGCLGGETPTAMQDGSALNVTVQEYVGAQTGAAYNNKGIPPDVVADDASATDRAIELLLQKR